MKIKAARRTLKKAYRNVDKEKMDQFKAAHEKKMKRALKRGARQVAKTGSIG